MLWWNPNAAELALLDCRTAARLPLGLATGKLAKISQW
jgi:hypothetical protein